MAYQSGAISLHARIKVRVTREVEGEIKSKIIETTAGRIIFNSAIPQNLGFTDRTDPETMFNLEIDYLVAKSNWVKLLSVAFLLMDQIRQLKSLMLLRHSDSVFYKGCRYNWCY